MRALLILVVASLGALAVGSADAAEIGPEEPAAQEATGTTERLIVVLDEDESAAAAARVLGRSAGRGTRVVESLEHLGLLIVEADRPGRAALSRSARVRSVVAARSFEPLLVDTGPVVQADVAHARGVTGSGRVVVVLDSGIDPSLGALAGAVVDEACILTGTPSPIVEGCPGTGALKSFGAGSGAACVSLPQACSHGTAVAGVVASNHPIHTGIAPGVDLISIRVTAILPSGPYIAEDAVLTALDHVVGLATDFDIAAVNLSFGGSSDSCGSLHWTPVIDALNELGIALVAASGNDGGDDPVAFPACLDGIVAVGATEPGVELASFTQYRGDLEVVAPGTDIETTVPTALDASGIASYTGTSVAAPQIAAALALIDPLHDGWRVERLVELLRSTGEMIPVVTPDPDDRDPRYPALRLAAAVEFEPFVDADHGFWVAPADWAKVAGVSTGVGGNSFAPDRIVDRAQVVTLLWRLSGSPSATVPSPFSDVTSDTWFADAVAWAFESGVTTGVSASSFAPAAPATRAQIATMLWRLVGTPASVGPNVFSDVDDEAFHADAVAWMARHQITTGTSPGEFSPDVAATRAQMITFLWRLVNAASAWTDADVVPDSVRF